MKTLIALFLLSVASVSFGAENCSFVVKDRYGYEYETMTRSGYSMQSACSDAEYACRVVLSNAQARGKYLDATCSYKPTQGPQRPPMPPGSVARCTTDLVDYYNNVLRSFSGVGRSQQEACQDSGKQCKIELTRNDSYGRRCVERGSGNGGNPPPRPPRQTTESCSAKRYDPAGYFIQSYVASHTGPVGSDVKGEACRKAFNSCSYDIKGRQTCRIER